MITNRNIDLSFQSIDREISRNTLIYTLGMDYPIAKIDSDSRKTFADDYSAIISKILAECQNYTHRLMQQITHADPNDDIPLEFFGTREKNNHSLFDKLFSVGCLLSPYKPGNSSDHTSTIHDMLANHCVISCYHAVRTALERKSLVTSYKIVRRHQRSATSSQASSSQASSLGRKIDKHLNCLDFIKDLIRCSDSHGRVRFRSQYSDLLYRISDINNSKFKYFFPGDGKHPKTDYELLLTNLTAVLDLKNTGYGTKSKKFTGNKKIQAEEIYNYYLFERIFNFRLFFTTMALIDYAHHDTIYNLSNPEFIEAINSFISLPNVYSRQLLLAYAFSFISGSTDSSYDIWDQFRSASKPQTEQTQRLYHPYTFNLSKWINQLKKMSDYLSDFVIPIYEWYFTESLLNGIRNAYQDKSENEHLKIALSMLENYIADNQQKIIHPLPDSLSEGLQKISPPLYEAYDILTPVISINSKESGSEVTFASVFPDIKEPFPLMDNLLKVFFSKNRHTELNLSDKLTPTSLLKPLNPIYGPEERIKPRLISLYTEIFHANREKT